MITDWHGVTLHDVMAVSTAIHGAGDVATSRVAQEMFRRAMRPDEEFEARMARTRWLEDNKAESSFPCGVVPRPAPGPREPVLNVLPIVKQIIESIIAVVLPTDLVFLLEGSPDIEELGRLPRSAIRDADAVDADGHHIPEPLEETFETDRPAMTVLRWTNRGVDDEERFAFRSVWMAWQAARRLRAARF